MNSLEKTKQYLKLNNTSYRFYKNAKLVRNENKEKCFITDNGDIRNISFSDANKYEPYMTYEEKVFALKLCETNEKSTEQLIVLDIDNEDLFDFIQDRIQIFKYKDYLIKSIGKNVINENKIITIVFKTKNPILNKLGRFPLFLNGKAVGDILTSGFWFPPTHRNETKIAPHICEPLELDADWRNVIITLLECCRNRHDLMEYHKNVKYPKSYFIKEMIEKYIDINFSRQLSKENTDMQTELFTILTKEGMPVHLPQHIGVGSRYTYLFNMSIKPKVDIGVSMDLLRKFLYKLNNNFRHPLEINVIENQVLGAKALSLFSHSDDEYDKILIEHQRSKTKVIVDNTQYVLLKTKDDFLICDETNEDHKRHAFSKDGWFKDWTHKTRLAAKRIKNLREDLIATMKYIEVVNDITLDFGLQNDDRTYNVGKPIRNIRIVIGKEEMEYKEPKFFIRFMEHLTSKNDYPETYHYVLKLLKQKFYTDMYQKKYIYMSGVRDSGKDIFIQCLIHFYTQEHAVNIDIAKFFNPFNEWQEKRVVGMSDVVEQESNEKTLKKIYVKLKEKTGKKTELVNKKYEHLYPIENKVLFVIAGNVHKFMYDEDKENRLVFLHCKNKITPDTFSDLCDLTSMKDIVNKIYEECNDGSVATFFRDKVEYNDEELETLPPIPIQYIIKSYASKPHKLLSYLINCDRIKELKEHFIKYQIYQWWDRWDKYELRQDKLKELYEAMCVEKGIKGDFMDFDKVLLNLDEEIEFNLSDDKKVYESALFADEYPTQEEITKSEKITKNQIHRKGLLELIKHPKLLLQKYKECKEEINFNMITESNLRKTFADYVYVNTSFDDEIQYIKKFLTTKRYKKVNNNLIFIVPGWNSILPEELKKDIDLQKAVGKQKETIIPITLPKKEFPNDN